MRNFIQSLKNLWAAAYNLDPLERRRAVRVAVWIGAVVALLVLILAGRTAGQVVPAEHPIWEAILQFRLAGVRLVLALPLVLLGACLGAAIYQLIENSELGRRLLIWDSKDAVPVMAQKTRNGGTLLATLVGSCILGLCLGVLR
jgi:hypothetical protein